MENLCTYLHVQLPQDARMLAQQTQQISRATAAPIAVPAQHARCGVVAVVHGWWGETKKEGTRKKEVDYLVGRVVFELGQELDLSLVELIDTVLRRPEILGQRRQARQP